MPGNPGGFSLIQQVQQQPQIQPIGLIDQNALFAAKQLAQAQTQQKQSAVNFNINSLENLANALSQGSGQNNAMAAQIL